MVLVRGRLDRWAEAPGVYCSPDREAGV